MERACDIDTKNSLDKPQNNRTHHDNRDVGEYKEENASNHSPEIIQKFQISQVLTLVSQKYSLQSELMSLYKKTLRYFRELSEIPRRSYEEKRVKKWLISWAKDNDWEHEDDEAGNLLIKAPGSTPETLCLQGHMDMVCVAQDSHDWSEEGVNVIEKDGVLW